jgi:myo-inositol-1(or 4)-monophosphatase
MKEFLAAAAEAAGAAGALLRETWREVKQVEYKSAIDLVTSVDRGAEERIVEVLLRRFPDHAILAEEKTSTAVAEGLYRWIVDPLDGTTNFVHSYPHFGISLALERAGRIVVGLVSDPLRRETFTAIRGEGAFLNDARIGVSNVAELDKALLATGFPYDRRERSSFYLSFFQAFMVRSQGIRRTGSAALDLCYLACGRVDGFWEWKLHPWDTAAGSLIVEEAGGRMSDFCGGPFSPWGEQTLASNGAFHDEMVEVLRKTLQSAG